MKRLTNLQFLYAVLTIFLMLGLMVAFYPTDGSSDASNRLFALMISSGIVVALIGRVIKRLGGGRSPFWQSPVSDRAANLVTNIVVLAWLAVLAVLTLFVLSKDHSSGPLATVILLVLTALSSGWYLKRRFGGVSLLPYGVSFLCAFILGILILVATRPSQ